MLNDIMAFLFPDIRKCINCNEEAKGDLPLCKKCEAEVTYYADYMVCSICGRFYHGPICQSVVKNMAVARYEGDWKELIHKFKFNNQQYLAKGFAKKMLQRLEKDSYPVDIITFIPVSKKTLKKRGFDQSALLAKELGKITRKTVIKSLYKKGNRPPQHTLSLQQRMSHWDGEFQLITQGDFAGKNLLLIDDIYTTGNTLYYGIKELEKIKCQNIKAMVLAN